MTETIRSHVLSNGLVLIAEPSEEVQSAAFSFLLPAAAAHDPAGKSGLASLTCEMMLRGCGDRDSKAFINDLECLGVERSEAVGTGLASYGGATLHSQLPDALAIFSDLLQRPQLPKDQLEAGQQVCLMELAAIQDDPAHQLMLELRRQFYPDPWGRNSLGNAAELLEITHEDIQTFHATYYRPNEVLLGVAGRVDWPALVDFVEKLFGDWQPAERPAVVEQKLEKSSHHLPSQSQQTQIGMAFPSVPYKDKDYFQAWGAVGVLSGGMSSRLFTEVREKRGLCYTVSASLNSQRDRAGVFCYAGTSAERSQETLDVTYQEIVRLGKDGVLPDELNRLKARIKSGLIMQQESSSARSGAIAREWYHLGHARTLQEIGDVVEALTAESINAYLAEHPPSDFTFVTMGPEPLEIPRELS